MRRPAYTLVAVAILALGISASVAAFTYARGFDRPIPGVDTERLVRVFDSDAQEPYRDISYLDFIDYARDATPLEGLAATTRPFYMATLRLEDITGLVALEAVSGSYFTVLGVETIVGRGLVPADDQPGAVPSAVISHAWWQRHFAGDALVIGTVIYLNVRPFTVVGVASPEFLGTASEVRPDVWIPFSPFADRYTRWASRAEDRDAPLVRVFLRLGADDALASARSRLTAAAARLDEAYPRQAGAARRLHLSPVTWIDPTARVAEGPTVRLMLLSAVVLLVLVCANVANLLLALASGRQRELSIRAALGAGPGRLFGQVLAENTLLSGLAGALALLLAAPLSARLGSYFARPSVWGVNVPRELAIDLEVATFALVISLLTGVLAGLLPAIKAARRDFVDTLRPDALAASSGGRAGGGRRLPGLNDVLIAAQIGLSVVLLVVAGLVLRTLASVGGLDPGIGVVDGRAFSPTDRDDAPDVAIVNEELSRRFFDGRSIGRRVWWPGATEGEEPREYEIVGVVRDTRTQDCFAGVEPTLYVSYPQHAYPTTSAVLISTSGDPRSAVPGLRRWLRDFEPHLAIISVVTYANVVQGLLYTHRMNGELYSVLALLGLLLAAVGIFSVMTLSVSRRTREIGIRISVGARRRDIARLVAVRALAPVTLGLAVGLGGSMAVSRLVRSLLHGVAPNDPVTLALAAGALVLAALATASIPAHRAARVDPVTALRHE